MQTVTLNEEQKLYVIPFSGGYSCFGFENCWRDVVDLSQKLGHAAPGESLKGTLACYELHQKLVLEFGKSPKSQRTWFTPGTDPKVSDILERYRKSDSLLRLFLGDPSTGRDWTEENDVVGRVGRSGGFMKVPLLVTPGDDGGGAILTDSIVRLMDVSTNKELYRCANYQSPDLKLAPCDDPALPQYKWAGYRENELIARFESLYDASEWLEFLTGRRAAKAEHFKTAYDAYRRAA